MYPIDLFKPTLNDVGWFIPPYVSMGFLGNLVNTINGSKNSFSQNDLQTFLAGLYSSDNMSAMVTERYPITPYISPYKKIISESVEAHFLGLDHIAVSGLMPVIEGAGRKLAAHREVKAGSLNETFINLANSCKEFSRTERIGNPHEVELMMDSFINFTKKNLFVKSKKYSLEDKTNRHGILHGSFTDKDYGNPINFYKSIASIDFLCFISAFSASISWFAPEPTKESAKLANYYQLCCKIKETRPNTTN